MSRAEYAVGSPPPVALPLSFEPQHCTSPSANRTPQICSVSPPLEWRPIVSALNCTPLGVARSALDVTSPQHRASWLSDRRPHAPPLPTEMESKATPVGASDAGVAPQHTACPLSSRRAQASACPTLIALNAMPVGAS